MVPSALAGIPESAVTGLVADLAAKAASSHAHAEIDVTRSEEHTSELQSP